MLLKVVFGSPAHLIRMIESSDFLLIVRLLFYLFIILHLWLSSVVYEHYKVESYVKL